MANPEDEYNWMYRPGSNSDLRRFVDDWIFLYLAGDASKIDDAMFEALIEIPSHLLHRPRSTGALFGNDGDDDDDEFTMRNRLLFYENPAHLADLINGSNPPPSPPQPPSTLFSSMEYDLKPIMLALQHFAATYQPQPLMSLYAYCLNPDPYRRTTWEQRLDDANDHMQNNNPVSDEDLLKDLITIMGKMGSTRSGVDLGDAYETKSILLNVLLTKTNAYSEALIRAHAQLNVMNEDGAVNPTTQLYQDLVQEAILFTTPLPFHFIRLGLAASLGDAIAAKKKKDPALWTRQLINNILDTCTLNDSVGFFVSSVELFLDILLKSDPTAQLTPSGLLDNILPDLMPTIAQHGCVQILSYLVHHHRPALTRAFTHQDRGFLRTLTDFNSSTYCYRMGPENFRRRIANPDRFRRSATFLLSLPEVREYFIQCAINHNTTGRANHPNHLEGNVPLPHRRVNHHGTASSWDSCLNDPLSPSHSVLNNILRPFIPNPMTRFSAFHLPTYLISDEYVHLAYIGESVALSTQYQSSWSFVLDEILIPMYQEHIAARALGQNLLPPGPPALSNVPSTTMLLTPNQPIALAPPQELLGFSESSLINRQLRHWYFFVYSATIPDPSTFNNMDIGNLKWVEDHPPSLPLIFTLLLTTRQATSPIRIPQLLSRREQYPINLNHVLKPEPTWTQTQIPIIHQPTSLTPLQFVVVRCRILQIFNESFQARTSSNHCWFDREDQDDSALIEGMLEYYLESILDGTVDIVHSPMTTVIHC